MYLIRLFSIDQAAIKWGRSHLLKFSGAETGSSRLLVSFRDIIVTCRTSGLLINCCTANPQFSHHVGVPHLAACRLESAGLRGFQIVEETFCVSAVIGQ